MLKAEPLLFGTDGWRGLIARQFTFANVRRVADALARLLPPKSRVAVAYDHRFMSEDFAREAGLSLAARGHLPFLADAATTSPALSHALKPLRAAAGVIITASHNPPGYNGFKIKVPPGRSADPTLTTRLEGLVEPEAPPRAPALPLGSFSPGAGYEAHLLSRREPRFWRKKTPTVVVDAMHGTGGPVWQGLFKRLGLRGEILRAGRDPLFGGVAPEPIEANLAPLVEAVRRNKAAIGLAVDGDADRLGVVDDTGAYLPPHTVFPLLLTHLAQGRKMKGAVVQAVSLGTLSERMARAWKMPFVEVPVGFKFVADEMSKRKTVLGGEESGGYGVGFWGLERDGILSGLMLLEFLMATGKPLSVLRREMTEAFGASDFQRVDIKIKAPVEDKAAWVAAVAKRVPERLAGRSVLEKRTRDGLKILLDGGAWLLLRPSGTEPLLRTYAESPAPALTVQLLHKAQEWAATKTS